MPKKLIRRLLPDHNKVKSHKHLKCFGTLLHDPNIWHLNRRSVSGALFFGMICAWIPVPFQMVIAAGVAILVRVNLPLCVASVWLTNPITMPPMFYFAYKMGAWILGLPERAFTFELSFDWLMSQLGYIWQPFLLGCALCGIVSAVTAFLAIRILWRVHIFQYIKKRRLRRKTQDRQDIA